jgi:hypothetical protein
MLLPPDAVNQAFVKFNPSDKVRSDLSFHLQFQMADPPFIAVSTTTARYDALRATADKSPDATRTLGSLLTWA